MVRAARMAMPIVLAQEDCPGMNWPGTLHFN